MKKQLIKTGKVLLAASLGFSMIPVSVHAEETDHPCEKTETVYTVLNADGSVSDISVSSWLHDEDGIHNVKEKLDLSDVENIKGNEKPGIDGNVYTWNSEQSDLYYTGKSEKKLPITVKISYEIDGRKMSAQEAQGKSGHLKLCVELSAAVSKEITVNGKKVNVHPSYLGGGLLKLDTEHYKNVKCENGKIVNDGTNEFLAFATIPGLSETLEQVGLKKVSQQLHLFDQTVIEADVNDFEPVSLMLGFTNEMSMEDLSGYLQDQDLSEGISQLFSASKQLLEGSKELYEGTIELNERVRPLTSAYPQIEQLASASKALHSGTSSLLQGMNAYLQGVEALNEGNQKLYAIPKGIGQAETGIASLTQGAQALQQGIEQLKAKTDQLDEHALEEAKQLLDTSQQTLRQMNQMIQKDQGILGSMETLLSQLDQSMQSLQQAKQAYVQAVEAYNQAVTENNKIVSENNKLIEQYQDEMNDANDHLAQAAKNTNDQIDRAVSQLQKTMNTVSDQETKEMIKEQIDRLEAGKVEAEQIQTSNKSLKKLKTVDPSKITAVLDQIQTGVQGLLASMADAETALSTLAGDIMTAQKTLQGMQDMIAKAEAGFAINIDEMAAQLKNGIDRLSTGSMQLADGCMKADAGMKQLLKQSSAGIDQINAASQELTDHNADLLGGIRQLDEGSAQLEAQKDQFEAMSNGLQELQTALDALQDGAGQLYQGQRRFADEGMQKLKEMLDLTVEELDTLQTILDETKALNKEYSSYAGAPAEAETTVRYLFKVSTIQQKNA